MAHFYQEALERPNKFNFATHVVDYWASTQPQIPALHWLSQDQSEYRILTFAHFQRQSYRIAALFDRLSIRAPQRIIMILPRTPAWYAPRFNLVKCADSSQVGNSSRSDS